MEHSVKDKVAMVTGGADGIGAAVVRALVAEGAQHVVIVDIAETKGLALREELNAKRPDCASFVACDVSSEQQLTAAYQAVTARCGRIDLVVNNAGVLNESLDTFMKEIAVNFAAVVSSTLKARELMRADKGGGGGTIINIASTAALIDIQAVPVYCGAKAGVLHFSTTLGMEATYSRTKVRVLAICFGLTDTTMTAHSRYNLLDKEFADMMQDIMNSFVPQPAEVAAKGVLDVYKQAASGTAWLVARSRPAKDVTYVLRHTLDVLKDDI